MADLNIKDTYKVISDETFNKFTNEEKHQLRVDYASFKDLGCLAFKRQLEYLFGKENLEWQ